MIRRNLISEYTIYLDAKQNDASDNHHEGNTKIFSDFEMPENWYNSA
jgi:hypothetical protein